MKKFISVLLVLLSAISLLPGAAMAAGTEITVSPPEALPKAGETFEVTVSVSGNPGICAAQLTLTYDHDALKCTKVKAGNLLSNFLFAENTDGEKGAVFAAASSTATSSDGVLAIITFTAKKDVSAFEFGVVDVKLADADRNPISYTVNVADAGNTSGDPNGSDPSGSGNGSAGGNQAGENPSGNTGDTEKLKSGFTDMPGHWAEKYVNKAAELGLFSGYPDGTFQPDKGVTRADFVTVLWRMSGRPEPAAANPFGDVANDMYYTKAITWAAEQGFVSGVSATEFNPSGVITREAAMRLLFAHSGARSGAELMFTSIYDDAFTDSGEISSWAKTAVYWGVYNSLIRGTSDTTLSPKTTATRGQLAKLLTDYMEAFMN